MTILDEILAHKREELVGARKALPPAELARRAGEVEEARRGFRAALAAGPRPRVIAEIKRRSPSRGEIRPDFEPVGCARAYAEASGRTPDPARLAFYDLLSVVKMAAIMLTGLRAFQEGRTHDLRMAIFDHQLPFLHALLAVTRGWLAGV